MNILKKLFVIVGIAMVMMPMVGFAHATNGTAITILGVQLNCDPSGAPSDEGNGCGFRDLIYFMKELINYLLVFMIPLAVGVIIWGGLVILTGGGSSEKLAKGKQVIKTAVWGLLIAFGSWLIINSIFLALTGAGVN